MQVSLEGNIVFLLGLVTGCRGCLLVCSGRLDFIVQNAYIASAI